MIEKPMAGASFRWPFVVLVALLLVVLAAAEPQRAAAASYTFIANDTADIPDINPGDGVCNADSAGDCTLRAAIQEANALGGTNTVTIDLLAGSVYTINTVTGPYGPCGFLGCAPGATLPDASQYPGLVVTSNVTIAVLANGRAAIQGIPHNWSELSVGGSSAPCFVDPFNPAAADCYTDWGVMRILRGATVNVSNVDFSAGTVGGFLLPLGNGGAISNEGTLTMTNSTLTANNGVLGGAIYNGGTATLTGVRMSGNTTSLAGNALEGGAVYNAGTLTLANSTVTGNSSPSGGGILNTGTLTLANDHVDTNSAGVVGGGILNNGTITDVSNSTISGNTGGGLQNTGTITHISNSTVSGNGGLGVATSGTINVNDSTVSGNSGGGFANSGVLSLNGVTVSANSAGSGAGINNAGTLSLTNSTISGNSATGNGGGILNTGTVVVNTATVALNVSDSDADGNGHGGGIFNVSGGPVSMANTILANNIDSNPTTKYPDCFGSFSSRGYNLIRNATGCAIGGDTTGNITGRDPQLGPLQNNGGPTQTHALLFVTAKSCTPPFGCFTYQVPSPAIDAGGTGGSATCPGTDQRGFFRPVDGNGDGIARCDIGAFEWTPPALPFPLGTWALTPTNATAQPGQRLAYTFGWTVPAGRGWRSLDTLQLRLFDGQNTGLWLRFHEVTGALGVFSLIDAKNGNIGPSFAPGSPNVLASNDATMYLADASVNGPPGRTVTLTLPLSFKPHAAGHVYDVLVLATDDNGQVQGFHRAGTVTVTR